MTEGRQERRFGLIGSDIAHSESPELFRKAYGGRWEYDLLDTGTFARAWAKFISGPYKAVNVTSPYKEDAFLKADMADKSAECCRAANILVKTEDGVKAYNSDYLGVKTILSSLQGLSSALVIGNGGAGKAALSAAQDSGLNARMLHHDQIADGAEADIIIYTLPVEVEGCSRLRCSRLLEANYKNPCLKGHPGYISGREWLRAQAETGYKLMTGEEAFLILEK